MNPHGCGASTFDAELLARVLRLAAVSGRRPTVVLDDALHAARQRSPAVIDGGGDCATDEAWDGLDTHRRS